LDFLDPISLHPKKAALPRSMAGALSGAGGAPSPGGGVDVAAEPLDGGVAVQVAVVVSDLDAGVHAVREGAPEFRETHEVRPGEMCAPSHGSTLNPGELNRMGTGGEVGERPTCVGPYHVPTLVDVDALLAVGELEDDVEVVQAEGRVAELVAVLVLAGGHHGGAASRRGTPGGA
jgi:hypothetical protein